MSHYETLGVQREATDDEIKQAFRRAASAAHPDKGGSDAQMSKINLAKDVLGDPRRRAHYDESGEDELPAGIDAEAKGLLMQFFNAVVENSDGDWLREVAVQLAQQRNQILSAKAQCSKKVARAMRRSGKIKVRKGENLVQMLIDAQIQAMNKNLDTIAKAILVVEAATTLLADYEGGIEDMSSIFLTMKPWGATSLSTGASA